MPLNKALAVAFDDEVVILDAVRGSLFRLDAFAALIWRFCDGSSAETIASSSHGAPERVRQTLQALTDAGLVRSSGDHWICGPVEWL